VPQAATARVQPAMAAAAARRFRVGGRVMAGLRCLRVCPGENHRPEGGSSKAMCRN
jgi:hypothetical protein